MSAQNGTKRVVPPGDLLTELEAKASLARPARRGRARRPRRGLLPMAGVLALFAMMVGSTLASPTSIFEITDGNVTDEAANPAIDWDTILGPGNVPAAVQPAGTVATQFLVDRLAGDALTNPPCTGTLGANDKGDLTVFTGAGGEKNGDAFSTMTWGAGSIPNNKDDLSNVYLHAQVDPASGHLIIYFGAERVATNGASHIDLEFLHSAMGFNVTGSDSNGCPKGTLAGTRTAGDILVTINFTNGGTLGVPEFRTWNGTSYVLAVPAGTSAGVTSNNVDTPCGDWTCRDTNGATTTTLLAQSFVEGFIDTADPAFALTGCLTGFNAHTRSSPEITATLKDLLVGGFNTCDANIQISPNGTNEVGQSHQFTGHVNVNPGTGFVNAPNGTTINFAIVSGPGQLSASSCQTAGGTGSCSVNLTSAVAGQTIVSASSNVSVNGTPFSLTTNGLGGNSGNATKTWVDAKIGIAQSATNAVGAAHTFTVTVQQDDGLTAAQGGDGVTGFAPAPVGNVDVTLTDSNGAVSVLNAVGSTCDDNQPTGDNLDASGQCTVVFTSNSAGQVTGHATVTLSVGGVSLTRNTNGVSPNSADAVKTFVDAKISISPNATNAVGAPHTFTVTVMQNAGDGLGFVAATVGNVDVTLTDSNGAVSVMNPATSTCDDNQPTGDNLDASGQCTTTFTSNSAGQVTGHATVTLTVGGVSLSRNTNGVSPNSADAVKTFVDAKIGITPNATNKVGDPHTFTVTVMQNAGDGAGFVAAPVGNVDVTLTDSNGAVSILDAAGSTCDDNQPTGDNLDASGQCTTKFTSNSAGTVTGHATVTLTVGGVSLTRSTNGVSPNSGDAVKNFVDASISIAPDATNAVGAPHTFTVTVVADQGGGSAPVTDGHVAFTLTDSNGAASVLNAAASTCDDAGDNLDASGQCTIVFTSNSAGKVTGHASISLTIGGVTFNLATDGTGDNSADAVKTFVDAKISIGNDATNGIGDPHTFTVTVMQNAGDGAGFVAAPLGNVDVTLTNGGGASSVLNTGSSTCDDNQPTGDNLNASGQCTVVFTSNSAGTVTGHATVTLTVGGVSLTRSTNGVSPNSDDAVKTFVDGSLRWIKHDNNGQLLGGATFQVCRTLDSHGTDIPDECVSVVDNSAPDTDPTGGEFQLVDLKLGHYTIIETAAPAGFTLDPTIGLADLTIANPDVTISYIWVNTPAGEGCTPGYWKNHAQLWDQTTDTLVVAMPAGYAFITTTKFNTYFNLTQAQSGFNNNFTMLDAIKAGGGGAKKLARHGVSALLNIASPINYPYTDFIATYNAIRNAYVTGTFEPLATDLAAANDLPHLHCPS